MIRPEDIRPSTPPTVLPLRLLRPAVIVPPPIRSGASVPVAESRGVLLPRPADATCDGGEPEVRR